MNELTAVEALNIIRDMAQWCRENGESDMRTILNTIRGIKGMMDEGKSKEEIIEAYKPDDEDLD